MKVVKDLSWCYEKWRSGQDVVFADCRFDLHDPDKGIERYRKGHIPSAVYFDLEKDLSSEVKETGGRHPLPRMEDFVETLQQAGISSDTTVIAYDDNHAFASRFVWLLTFLGHENVYLLNGGIKAWKEAGYPVDQDMTPRKKTTFKANVHKEFVADQDDVRERLNHENVAIVDSRNYERYAGIHEPIDAKAGHIPGALNYFWMDLFDERGFWKEPEQLKEHFYQLNSYDEIIVYCGSGVTAAPNVISLWEAGFQHVRLYVGSFSDWISNPENKIDTCN